MLRPVLSSVMWPCAARPVFPDTLHTLPSSSAPNNSRRFFNPLTHEDPRGSKSLTTLLWKPHILQDRYSAYGKQLSCQSPPNSPVLHSLPWGVWSTVDENAVSKISASEVGLPTTPCPEYDLACADSHGRCLEVGAGAVTRSPIVHVCRKMAKQLFKINVSFTWFWITTAHVRA